jgi:hypothetical protein
MRNEIGRSRAATTELRIGETPVGKGLFVTRPYVAGEEILVFTGALIDFETTLTMGERECNAFQIGPNRYLDLDAPGVFINHSCDPNTGVCDDIRLVALRDLRPGEEIRYDYSTTMDEDQWEMHCRCGSPSCRGVIRDFKWLPNELKLGLMSRRVVPRFLVDAQLGAGRISETGFGSC